MALEKVVTDEEFPSNITEGNFKTIKQWDEGQFASFISEYYYDENEEELRLFAEQEDLEQAKKIIEKLKNELSSEFEMTAHLEDW